MENFTYRPHKFQESMPRARTEDRRGRPQPVAEAAVEMDKRRIVGIGPERVTNTTSTDFPGHYPGEDHEWSIEKFKKNFTVQFHHNHPYDSSFSLIHIDPSIANAFRRILLSEIPTLAVEFVYINNNTSIIHDEVLAHRLGLVPLTGALEGLNWLKWYKKADKEKEGDKSAPPSDFNTVVLRLKAECTVNPDVDPNSTNDPKLLYNNAHVYAKDFVYQPVGRQGQHFPDGVRAVNPDILLAKMRPGQAIDLELHCIKGIGADHAKFSPVSTATYRLLPTIDIVRPILGQDAKKFARCFPRGVISVSTVTDEEAAQEGSGYEDHAGEAKAVVADPFRDTVSRECLRHPEFADKVKLGRVKDHFIFSVESTGQFESDLLFLESVKVLKLKCQRLKRDMANLMQTA